MVEWNINEKESSMGSGEVIAHPSQPKGEIAKMQINVKRVGGVGICPILSGC